MIEIKLTKNNQEIVKALKIRTTVFGKEQKIKREMDFDGHDKEAVQVLVFSNKVAVGCARIRMIDNKAKLERIAVLKKHRGKGVGALILNYLLSYCKKKKVKYAYLDAQAYLQSFYEKFGFKVVGKPFTEVGIKHVRMEKVAK